MPRTFEFHSTGKAIGDALDELLVQRELRKQQIIENQLRQAQEARTQAQEGRLNRQLALSEETQRGAAEDRRQAAKDREAERRFRKATTIATVGLPGPTTEETAGLLEGEGYGTLVQRTPPGREFAAQDPTTGQDVFYETPGIVSFTGGTQYQAREDTQQARAEAARLANEARVEAAKAAAMERADRAAERQMFQESQNALNRQIQQGNLDIRREAADREARAATEKREREMRETEEKRQVVANTRASIRNLAQELADDPNLTDITGMLEGRMGFTLTEGNQQTLAKFNQLKNMLALGEREKLKGQGSVSNFEGQMLASAVSALDRAAGYENTRKLLTDIAQTFRGDSPAEAPVPGTTRNPSPPPGRPPSRGAGAGPGPVGAEQFTIIEK